MREIHLVQASDMTYIVRSMSAEGVSDIQTARDFSELVTKLDILFGGRVVSEAPSTQQ